MDPIIDCDENISANNHGLHQDALQEMVLSKFTVRSTQMQPLEGDNIAHTI